MNALEQGLYSKLSGTSALTTLLANATSVYNQIVPKGKAYPLVIFNLQGGGDENDTPKRRKNYVYLAKAVSAVSMKQAGLIDAQIDAALHEATLTVTGWTNFWCMRTTDIRYTETTAEGANYFHSGGLYRIRICE